MEAKGGHGRVGQACPLDMVRPLSKAMPGQANPPRIYVAEGRGELRGNPKRLRRSHAVKKSLVAVELEAPVPQTDSGR